MENKVPFRVVRGIENNINQIEYQDGQVYFATDTKKIYLDTNQQRIPMGGNTGIYYGKASQPDVAEEFFFYPYEIEDGLIPNVKDLIINTDGCFYKVEEVRGEVIKTSRLTIAGTGNGTIEEKGEINLSIKDFSSYNDGSCCSSILYRCGECENKRLAVSEKLGKESRRRLYHRKGYHCQ